MRITRLFNDHGEVIGIIPVIKHFSDDNFKGKTGWLLLDKVEGENFYYCGTYSPFPQGFARVFARLENGRILGYRCFHDEKALPNHKKRDGEIWFTRLYLQEELTKASFRLMRESTQQFRSTPGARITHYKVPKSLKVYLGDGKPRNISKKFLEKWLIITNLDNQRFGFQVYSEPTADPKTPAIDFGEWIR